jgi:hypothetical protein
MAGKYITKWDYHWDCNIYDRDIQRIMENARKDCWELVSVTESPGGLYSLFFKRLTREEGIN